MICRKCGANNNIRRIETRHRMDGLTRRRAECLSCGERMTTLEMHKDDYDELVGHKFFVVTDRLDKRIKRLEKQNKEAT